MCPCVIVFIHALCVYMPVYVYIYIHPCVCVHALYVCTYPCVCICPCVCVNAPIVCTCSCVIMCVRALCVYSRGPCERDPGPGRVVGPPAEARPQAWRGAGGAAGGRWAGWLAPHFSYNRQGSSPPPPCSLSPVCGCWLHLGTWSASLGGPGGGVSGPGWACSLRVKEPNLSQHEDPP